MHGSEILSERSDIVRPQSASDIVARLSAGITTLAEARYYLGLPEEWSRCA
jgi:hypothetical protein